VGFESRGLELVFLQVDSSGTMSSSTELECEIAASTALGLTAMLRSFLEHAES
jgi:hypothetical protein